MRTRITGSLKPCALDPTRRGRTKLWYIISCWRQRSEQRNPIPAGVKSWGAVELVLRQDLQSFVRSVQQVEDDDTHRLIYRFTVNR